MPQHLQVSKNSCTFAADFRRETRKLQRKRDYCLPSQVKSGKFQQLKEEVVNQRSRLVYVTHLVPYTCVGCYFSFVSFSGIPEPTCGRIRNNSPRFLVVWYEEDVVFLWCTRKKIIKKMLCLLKKFVIKIVEGRGKWWKMMRMMKMMKMMKKRG